MTILGLSETPTHLSAARRQPQLASGVTFSDPDFID
jgi:hypothetical protein